MNEQGKPVIKSLIVARKIGFSAGLEAGSIYKVEKARWGFALGRNNFRLQTAFRKGFRNGKFELNHK